MRTHRLSPSALLAALPVALLAVGLAGVEAQAAPPDGPAHSDYVWLDIEGKPLPIQTHEELEEFLRTASVVDSDSTEFGRFGARRLQLKKDGVVVHACGRTIAVEDRKKRLKDREVWFFRDHYIHEPAAYAISELLGLGMVPPAVERSVNGKPGSVQIWVEKGMVETQRTQRGIDPPDERGYMLQHYQMCLFDNLINNIDRNQGNIVIDPDWRLWLIDHGRAFIRDQKLPTPQHVRRVERGVWERLRSVSDEELDAALEPYLGGPERAAVLKRRQLLVELIEEKIARLGEDGILFSW